MQENYPPQPNEDRPDQPEKVLQKGDGEVADPERAEIPVQEGARFIPPTGVQMIDYGRGDNPHIDSRPVVEPPPPTRDPRPVQMDPPQDNRARKRGKFTIRKRDDTPPAPDAAGGGDKM